MCPNVSIRSKIMCPIQLLEQTPLTISTMCLVVRKYQVNADARTYLPDIYKLQSAAPSLSYLRSGVTYLYCYRYPPPSPHYAACLHLYIDKGSAFSSLADCRRVVQTHATKKALSASKCCTRTNHSWVLEHAIRTS